MNATYRLRPCNDRTIEELENMHFWFSKPECFNDNEDANICAFVNNNENIADSFDRVFGDSKIMAEEMRQIGICCFTKELPSSDKWRKFPNSAKGMIAIEFDRDKMEGELQKCYGVSFCDVDYQDNPTKILSSTKDGYDVLWETTEDGKVYKSLRGDIELCIKTRDEFFRRMLTRINSKYRSQNECRLIAGPRVINKLCKEITFDKGYKIPFSDDCINKIYYNDSTPKEYIEKLEYKFSKLRFEKL